jgi:hypothetical protein
MGYDLRYTYARNCSGCCLYNSDYCECTVVSTAVSDSTDKYNTPILHHSSDASLPFPSGVTSSTWLEKIVFVLGQPMVVIEIETNFDTPLNLIDTIACSPVLAAECLLTSRSVVSHIFLADLLISLQNGTFHRVHEQPMNSFAHFIFQWNNTCDAVSVFKTILFKSLFHL